jgi:hypothetical protein
MLSQAVLLDGEFTWPGSSRVGRKGFYLFIKDCYILVIPCFFKFCDSFLKGFSEFRRCFPDLNGYFIAIKDVVYYPECTIRPILSGGVQKAGYGLKRIGKRRSRNILLW